MTAAHTTTEPDPADEESADARQSRYALLLGIVEKNTGHPADPIPKRAGILPEHVAVIATHAGEHEMARKTSSYLSRAVENGDVASYRDAEDRTRYARATVRGLKAVVAQHNVTDDPGLGELEARVLPALREVDDGE